MNDEELDEYLGKHIDWQQSCESGWWYSGLIAVMRQAYRLGHKDGANGR